MTTHETLKRINDIIGHTPKFEYQEYDGLYSEFTGYGEYYKGYDMTRMVDVREIIFDPVFMEKLIEYRKHWKIEPTPCKSLKDTFYSTLIEEHLHDPTSYLANLLGIGTEKN